jgi:hypothetical protein
MDSQPPQVPPVIKPAHYQNLQAEDTLLSGFWLFVGALIIWSISNTTKGSVNSIIGTSLMAFSSLLPSYLWCSKKALGLPIFPLFTLTYLWTYALQPLTNDTLSLSYSQDRQLFASLTVTVFLSVATIIWYQFVNSAPAPLKYYRAFSSQKAEPFFLLSLVVGNFFTMSSLGGWSSLDGGLFSIIRAIVLATNGLAIFVLAYNWGNRKLAQTKIVWFVILLVINAIANAVSLVLVASISAFLLATIAFVFGRRQIPWLIIVIALISFGYLNVGKAEMRTKYWNMQPTHYVQPWEYPSWFSEWIGYSLNYLNAPPLAQIEEKEAPLKRSSLIHLLLMVQDKSPREIPYLSGQTYAIIPQLLMPRFLNANKVTSHEGTHLLNIHYGLQNRQDTERTTIGWGLLNESYANFGFLGCLGLAIAFGYGYGAVTRWSMNTPILSARFLFATILISFAFQTEFSAGVYVSALFQSAIPLVAVSFTLMKVYTNAVID